MRKLFILLIASISLFACKNKEENSSTTSTSKVKLSNEEFADTLKKYADAQLLDVRTPKEFQEGHLANAKNFDWNGSFKTDIASLDKTKPVMVYCFSGARSSDAADYLRNNGFANVYELKGGILGWKNAKMPLSLDQATTEVSETTSTSGMTLDGFNQLTNSDKVVLVDFYAEWCGPCKAMEPHLTKFSDKQSAKVKVVRIDVDQNPALAEHFQINSIPYLAAFKSGKKVWDNIGFMDEKGLNQASSSW